jgi:hypothetical protein
MIFTCCSAPASAALVALLFVAVSIGASFLTPERSVATRTFMSPVVFHFSTLLIISLIAMVPSHTALSLAIGITLDVYVRNMEHFDRIHKVRREYFKPPAPASTMVEVCKMTSPDYLIEMSAIAVVGN